MKTQFLWLLYAAVYLSFIMFRSYGDYTSVIFILDLLLALLFLAPIVCFVFEKFVLSKRVASGIYHISLIMLFLSLIPMGEGLAQYLMISLVLVSLTVPGLIAIQKYRAAVINLGEIEKATSARDT